MDKGKLWDVIVVGGGPAGMMAAATAAENGSRVVLLEKNDSLGKKLLITGGGRCNLTNSEFDNRKLLSKFKADGKFLFSAFSQWSVKETLEYFHKRGMATKVENELRTFPVSDSARSVWDVLVRHMAQNNVEVRSNCQVDGLLREGKNIIGVKIKGNGRVLGRSVIIATGGKSHPYTGSTGDGFKWLVEVGHTVIEPIPSLVPLAIKEAWIKKLAGLTLDGIKLTVIQSGRRQGSIKGKVLFTHTGVSGPTVLNMSRDVGELLKYGEVIISLDLMPRHDHGDLDKTIQTLLSENGRKTLRNVLPNLVPAGLVEAIMEISGIGRESKCNVVTREQRIKLVSTLKGLPLSVKKLLGVDKAIITSGGIALEEVDFKRMSSRLYPNLFLIGDILNVDRPSGGYSLQLCWTTGFVAGRSAAKIV